MIAEGSIILFLGFALSYLYPLFDAGLPCGSIAVSARAEPLTGAVPAEA